MQSADQNPPLIIAGMHRSGTSMITSFLASNGLAPGEELVPEDAQNPRGYFEDVAFVELQRKMLIEGTEGGLEGWPDWGYREDEKLSTAHWPQHREAAIALLAEKAHAGLWGWKDPRSTLLLDFWRDLEPNARFLLIYRNPWEVKRSIQKLNAPVFNEHPDYAFRIWNFYNQHMLRFYASHPDQCALVCANAFLHDPARLIALLTARFGYGFDSERAADTSFYTSELFYKQNTQAEHREFLADEAVRDTLHELHLKADLPGDAPDEALLAPAQPRISVVIPCYNHGQYVRDALFSVERSTNRCYELIVVNDGSTQTETQETVAALKAEGYHIIDQENQGLSAARNNGIAAAKADYLLLLDADNKVDPEYLTAAIAVLDQDPEVGVVYANPRFFGAQSMMRSLPDFDFGRLLSRNYIDACAVIRKSCWEAVGGYDTNMKLGYEDWEFWIRVAKAGWKFHHLDRYLFDYRVARQSMVTVTNQPANREQVVRYITEKHQDVFCDHAATVITNLNREVAETEAVAHNQREVIEGAQAYNQQLLEELERIKGGRAYQLLKKLKNVLGG
ncbi:MAG: glycosyltransferase [Bacteroidota bacterium]